MNKILLIFSILIFSFSMLYAQELSLTEIDQETQDKIANVIKTFEKNDSYKDFSIGAEETYYDVFLNDTEFSWQVSKNFEVIAYMDWTNLNDRMNVHSENATQKREDLLKNAVDYINLKGISLVNHTYYKEADFFGNGCYEYWFQCNLNDQKEGLTDAQYIKVCVGSQDGKIYEFAKDTRPITFIVDNNIFDDNKLLETSKSFFPNQKNDKLEFSISSPCLNETTNKLVYTIFIIGDEASNFIAELEFDAYNGALLSATTPEDCPKFSSATLAKIEEYKKTITPKEQPALGQINYPVDIKNVIPSEEILNIILTTDTKTAENGTYDLAKFTKLFDNIYSIKLNDKNYIFKNNSSWCLIDNIPTKMSGIFTASDKIQLPADFGKQIGL